MRAVVLFPHQLWFEFPKEADVEVSVFLIEEYLYFKQYPFHKQKIAYHRATMKCYAANLEKQGFRVYYIDSFDERADIRVLIAWFKDFGYHELTLFEPDDFLLRKRIVKATESHGMKISWHPNQLFINTLEDLMVYKSKSKRLFQTDFYIYQRKLRGILLDETGNPLGGKWSCDTENRKKYPAKKIPPVVASSEKNEFHEEAERYVKTYFSHHLGRLNDRFYYPTNPDEAELWFRNFLESRFAEFGDYEDAIVADASFLNHAVLTPMLNVGILKPMKVLQEAITYGMKHRIALNNIEGFVRQILGWREFVRYAYHFYGVNQRTRNFWGFNKKMPEVFYSAKTGMKPVDDAIKKLLKTAYNHHIERLMVLSNFMLLCEIHPDDVYRWFMELYIDAYDWVMVPNVYGMAQFSDGGLMVTKPYISSSNYILKMSDYKKDPSWSDIWDALFWRFLIVNRDFFKRNQRLSMLIKTFDKWPEDKKNALMSRAENYLNALN
jgi:deoxyribodipyrimidine photolyase-related protein